MQVKGHMLLVGSFIGIVSKSTVQIVASSIRKWQIAAVQKENTRTNENPLLMYVYAFHGTTVINGQIRCATTFNLTDHVSWSHDESPLLMLLIVVGWDSTLPRLAYI